MHPFKRFLLFLSVFLILAASIGFLWLSKHHTTPILMYHHIMDTDEDRVDVVSPANFERHLDYLVRNRYRVVSFDRYIRDRKRGKRIPHKTVVITFDDGMDNNYTHAFKILKKFDFPAIIFMPSDRIDQPGHLTLAQLKEMMAYGIEIGSHTRDHKYLPDLDRESQRDEIIQSKKILEDQLGVRIDYFSYPIGGYNDEIKAIVKEAGYTSAVTTNRGYDKYNYDVFELNRIKMTNNDFHFWDFMAKFSGFYNVLRSPKTPY